MIVRLLALAMISALFAAPAAAQGPPAPAQCQLIVTWDFEDGYSYECSAADPFACGNHGASACKETFEIIDVHDIVHVTYCICRDRHGNVLGAATCQVSHEVWTLYDDEVKWINYACFDPDRSCEGAQLECKLNSTLPPHVFTVWCSCQ